MQFTVSNREEMVKPTAGRYHAKVIDVKLKTTKGGNPMRSVKFLIRLKDNSRDAKVFETFFLSGAGSWKAFEFVRAIVPTFKHGDPLDTDFLIDKRVEIEIEYTQTPKTEWQKDNPVVKACYPLVAPGDSFTVTHEMYQDVKETFENYGATLGASQGENTTSD